MVDSLAQIRIYTIAYIISELFQSHSETIYLIHSDLFCIVLKYDPPYTEHNRAHLL